MWTVLGALALLERRHRTGRGGVVNTSLLETALLWAGQKISSYVNTGKMTERHASGHPNFVPYQAFDAADGPILVCCGNDRLFARFAGELGHPEWVKDDRFATNRQRLVNQKELLPLIADIMKETTRAEWLQRLQRSGIPCAPVNAIPEVLEEPQVQALGMVQPVPGEDFALVALPLSFDGERPQVKSAAPRLGADNARLAKAAE